MTLRRLFSALLAGLLQKLAENILVTQTVDKSDDYPLPYYATFHTLSPFILPEGGNLYISTTLGNTKTTTSCIVTVVLFGFGQPYFPAGRCAYRYSAYIKPESVFYGK